MRFFLICITTVAIVNVFMGNCFVQELNGMDVEDI